MRLIDADDLLKDCIFPSIAFERGMRAFIGDAPTIDAVPVVRCKDCKHGYVIDTGVEVFNMCRLNYIIGQVDGWFCADGKRRDNDPTQTQHVESVGQHTQDVGMR